MRQELFARIEGTLEVAEVLPVPRYEDGKRVLDGNGDPAQAIDRETGDPLWNIRAIYRCPGEKTDIIEIKVASKGEPAVKEGQKVPNTLVCHAYQRDGWVAYSYRLPLQKQEAKPEAKTEVKQTRQQ